MNLITLRKRKNLVCLRQQTKVEDDLMIVIKKRQSLGHAYRKEDRRCESTGLDNIDAKRPP